MIAVQEATARIGATTGKGLAKVTAENFPRRILLGVVGLIVFANVINIGADIAAVGAALHLLIDIPEVIIATLFTLFVITLMIFTNYHVYARILKIFALALIAYVITALIVAEPWREIARATFIPQFQWSFAYWYVIVGVLGTTISPYMFFWQAAEEVEELEYADQQHRLRRTISDIRWDTSSGMVISQLGSWFMMLTTATVLHPNGITNIGTAADAAKALEPFAGTFAKEVFAIGVVGMGLLGIPVLAGSASYAVSELFGWDEGLNKKAHEAKGFNGVIIAATVVGFALTLMGFDPIRALIFAAVVNGLVAVPLVFLIRRIATNREIMGSFVSGKLSTTVLWLTFIIMAVCALVMIGAGFLR
jgi:Mn2+/Fe2+ NRAMP family transporter